MERKKIGVDFDEVIVESWKAFRELLKEKGFVPPKEVYRHGDWKDAPITAAEYQELMYESFRHEEWPKMVQLLPGAKEALWELLELDIDIDIITARGVNMFERTGLKACLEHHGFGGKFGIVFTNYQSKAPFLREHILMIDDQEHELLSIAPSVHRLLLSRPHNEKAWQSTQSGIIPVRDWPHAMTIIREILKT